MRYLLSILLALPTIAKAQIGIYGLFNANRLTGQASPGTQDSSNWLYGPTIGVFYTPVHLGPLAAGLDLRGNYASGSNLHLRGAQLGLRVSGKGPILPLRPYALGSVGIAGVQPTPATSPFVTHYTNKFAYGVLGGLDITVLPLVDLRVVELGYGHVTGVSSGTPATATNLFNLGAGIVVRLP